MFDTVVIYGVGLLGGSIGLAVKEKRLAKRVLGIGRNAGKLHLAKSLGALDEFATDLTPLDSRCQFAVVCTPVGLIPQTVADLAEKLPLPALITDVGSTKARIVQQVEAFGKTINFVGSHPMAGSEKTGVENSTADLYQDALCIITPGKHTSLQSVETLEFFWKSLGARVLRWDPEVHDRLVAAASHLPHLAATCLSRFLGQTGQTDPSVFEVAGEGFRDTTRIAAGDPVMWRDICTDNRDAIIQALDSLIHLLEEMKQAIETNQSERIRKILEEGQSIRLQIDRPRKKVKE